MIIAVETKIIVKYSRRLYYKTINYSHTRHTMELKKNQKLLVA